MSADASSRACVDFTQTSQGSSWTPEGGAWSVVNGEYVGTGPASPLSCVGGGGSVMTASFLGGFNAADVRLHVQMTSVDRADKVIVLRSRDSGDRIELNFVAHWNDNGTQAGGMLVVQKLVNCEESFLVPPNTVSVPHDVGDTLTVDLELRGTRLTVKVGGAQVFDGTLAIATDPGKVGLAVIFGGTVRFDDLWVEALN
jgi:hypothetical protein